VIIVAKTPKKTRYGKVYPKDETEGGCVNMDKANNGINV
jgi:hypothetical protein